MTVGRSGESITMVIMNPKILRGKQRFSCKRSLGLESDNKSSGPARSAKAYLQIGSSLNRGPSFPPILGSFLLIRRTSLQLLPGLESKFRDGMTWENYGPFWHVDHIRPWASFDLSDPSQQKLCFHWTNLQPLLATENLAKGVKPLITDQEPKASA